MKTSFSTNVKKDKSFGIHFQMQYSLSIIYLNKMINDINFNSWQLDRESKPFAVEIAFHRLI